MREPEQWPVPVRAPDASSQSLLLRGAIYVQTAAVVLLEFRALVTRQKLKGS